MKSTFRKMTALLSVLLAGTLLAATAVAQLGAAHAGGWGTTMTVNWPKWLNWNSFTQPFTRQSACTIQ